MISLADIRIRNNEVFWYFCSRLRCLFFEGAPEQHFCSGCGSCIGKDKYYPENLDIRKLKKNIATTYDNRLLLSNVAREFLIEKSTTQLTFKLVNKNPDIYVMKQTKSLLLMWKKGEHGLLITVIFVEVTNL